MIDNNTKEVFVELWKNHPEPFVFAAIYIIGFNITLFAWWRKNVELPNWLYWTTLWLFDLKIVKSIFIQGPGVLFVIIWMIIGSVFAFIIF